MRKIHQEIAIGASTKAVYAALTEATRFSEMSGGAPADIDPTDGGAFSCFGGMILGRNIECVEGRRLVQAWRAKTWPEGVYSVVRFELEETGANATRLLLDHVGYPDGQGEHLAEGWHTNYWTPMRALLGE